MWCLVFLSPKLKTALSTSVLACCNSSMVEVGAELEAVPYATLMFWCRARNSFGLRRSASCPDSEESIDSAEDGFEDVEGTGREETRARAAAWSYARYLARAILMILLFWMKHTQARRELRSESMAVSCIIEEDGEWNTNESTCEWIRA